VLQIALREAATTGRFRSEGGGCARAAAGSGLLVIERIEQDGRLMGFAKKSRDINEQRQVQLAALQREQQFRMLAQGETAMPSSCSVRTGMSPTGMPAPTESKIMSNPKSSDTISPASAPRRTGRSTCHANHGKPPSGKGATNRKAAHAQEAGGSRRDRAGR